MKKNNICIFSQNLSPKSFSWKIDKRSEINKGKFIKKKLARAYLLKSDRENKNKIKLN